uniref:Uncharacterized protein n=1 Tax=Oryza rufipogon TaxID=4529 RepID=A0A0E0NGB4_ORYRU
MAQLSKWAKPNIPLMHHVSKPEHILLHSFNLWECARDGERARLNAEEGGAGSGGMVRRGGWGAAMWGRREVGCGGRGRNNRGLGGAVIFSLTAGRDPEEERDGIAHSSPTD